MLQSTRAITAEDYQQAYDLRAEMGRWDAAEAERLGLNPQEVLAFFYAADVQTIAKENAPPHGELLLARFADSAVGCAAFRQVDSNTCELHHVYVRDQFRRLQIGRQMVEWLVAAALGAGYKVMWLETTTFMQEARALYTSICFRQRGPYYAVPAEYEPFTVLMELTLVLAHG